PSYTIHRNEEDNIKNRYKLTAVSGSLFASYESGCGYFNAIGNVGWLDLNSIKRKFPLGPVDHEAHGSTNGMDYLAQIYGSYFVWNCENRLSTGPKANAEFQRVFIDGYKESGAAIGNIEYKDQDNTSIITGLGWEAKFRIPMSYVSMFGDVFLMFNRQWHSRNRDISIRERSLDVPAGKWPIYTPRFNFASGGINLTTTFSRGVSLGIRYQFNLGTFDIKEHFINLSLTFPI
ncbi:MAG: hypothetical protein K1000chlam2_01793, partial [Chlamydiae bacterium]|nr:hypothetical protein [Chlamydiota bacterium]